MASAPVFTGSNPGLYQQDTPVLPKPWDVPPFNGDKAVYFRYKAGQPGGLTSLPADQQAEAKASLAADQAEFVAAHPELAPKKLYGNSTIAGRVGHFAAKYAPLVVGGAVGQVVAGSPLLGAAIGSSVAGRHKAAPDVSLPASPEPTRFATSHDLSAAAPLPATGVNARTAQTDTSLTGLGDQAKTAAKAELDPLAVQREADRAKYDAYFRDQYSALNGFQQDPRLQADRALAASIQAAKQAGGSEAQQRGAAFAASQNVAQIQNDAIESAARANLDVQKARNDLLSGQRAYEADLSKTELQAGEYLASTYSDTLLKGIELDQAQKTELGRTALQLRQLEQESANLDETTRANKAREAVQQAQLRLERAGLKRGQTNTIIQSLASVAPVIAAAL